MSRSRLTVVLLAGLVAAATPVPAQQFPAATEEAEAKLLAVLKSDDASREEKATACRRLAVVGTRKAVPVLAGLLGDEALSHMARYALEPIPDPSVDAALRQALGKVKGRPLVGVVGSLGVRKDAKAVPLMAPLLGSLDADVAHAAARALGSIGTPEAVKALQNALGRDAPDTQRLALCEGLFRAAEALADAGKRDDAVAVYDHLRGLKKAAHQVRTAAVRGAILARGKDGLPLLRQYLGSDDYLLFAAACRASHEMEEPGATTALADALGRGSDDRKVLVLLTLGRRKDAAAVPAVMAVAKDQDADKAVRLQAIRTAA
ncbi:MAG: HEAT repeat domain-containing protein, partial [Planctomycetota bacterium]|nr:HEAT repeat domain-containing protein [Planctomycetota bacterium]